MKYFPLEDVMLTGNTLTLCTPLLYCCDPGLVTNLTSLPVADLPNFLTSGSVSHAFRGGPEHVAYHGVGVADMYALWGRALLRPSPR